MLQPFTKQQVTVPYMFCSGNANLYISILYFKLLIVRVRIYNQIHVYVYIIIFDDNHSKCYRISMFFSVLTK